MFPIFVAPLSKSSSNLMLISLQMYLFLCSSLICCGSFTFIVNLFFFMFHITILSWHNFYTWCKLSYSVLPFFLISSFYCFPVFWLISKMIFCWITCFFLLSFLFHDSFFNSHIFQYCHLNHLLFYFCWFYLGCHILFPYIFCSRFESVGLLLLFYCEIFRNRWFYRTQPVAVFVAIALDVWWMSQHVLSDQVMIRSSQGRCCLHEYKILLTVPKIDWGLYWLRHLC